MKKSSSSGGKEKKHAKPALGRAIWSGSISFGLVNIPVKLYAALKNRDVRFHLLHVRDKSRIEERIFCAAENKMIPRDQTVRGYEIAPGQYVIIKDEELQALAPQASRSIELIQFVQLREIDPLFFERPYFMVPEETARKPYSLLTEALRKSGKAGIARFVMRKKEYLCVMRPISQMLYLETMHFADEIVSSSELTPYIENVPVHDRELKTAQELIESLTDTFQPAGIHDHYREAVMKLIEDKAEGREIAITPEPKEKPVEVVDLMSALKASLADAKRKKKKREAA